MSDANNISFRFGGFTKDPQGSCYGIAVRLLKSDWEALKGAGFADLREKYGDANGRIHANDLLRLMHSARSTRFKDTDHHEGFDYTLDFQLARGYGFPYILDDDYLE